MPSWVNTIKRSWFPCADLSCAACLPVCVCQFVYEGETGEDELGEGLSAEALVRLQKARISVLTKQLQDALEGGKDMDKKVGSLEAEVRK